MISMQDLIVILVIVLVLYGKRRLREVAKGIVKGITNYKEGLSEPDEINITPAEENKGKKEATEKKADPQPRKTADDRSRRRQ